MCRNLLSTGLGAGLRSLLMDYNAAADMNLQA